MKRQASTEHDFLLSLAPERYLETKKTSVTLFCRKFSKEQRSIENDVLFSESRGESPLDRRGIRPYGATAVELR